MSPLRLWLGRLWKVSSGVLLVIGIALLCWAEPGAKKYGLALLIADLAQMWLGLHRQWQRRTMLDTLRVLGGITFATLLVSLGAFILFAQTCLPFRLNNGQ